MGTEKKYADAEVVIEQSKSVFPERLESALMDMEAGVESTEESIGYVTLEDGRVAQITFKVSTDESEWLDDGI
jgi:hypothetical protein